MPTATEVAVACHRHMLTVAAEVEALGYLSVAFGQRRSADLFLTTALAEQPGPEEAAQIAAEMTAAWGEPTVCTEQEPEANEVTR